MFIYISMDLPYAIERHREPLLAIIAGFYAMIGLAEGGSIERVSRTAYRAVLALLRPAESAVRRLIIVAAQGLELKPQASRAASAKRSKSSKSKAKRKSGKAFPLFDPRLRRNAGMSRPLPRAEPRITFFHNDPLVPAFLRPAPPQPAPKPKPDGTMNAKSLCRRIAAALDALRNIDRQAKRYLRLKAKLIAERDLKPDTFLRRGSPPGLRRNSKHEVHEILMECQWLARTVTAPDTG